MTLVKFIVTIIGLIVCIRSKNKFSKYGTIFFLLLIVQFAYLFVEIKFFYPYFEDMLYNKVIDPETFGIYGSLVQLPEYILEGASLVAIIFGIVKSGN
ncbi:hypothetical protein SAMN02745751_03626 [Dethiosulfatibacter aminovorans DSM 17477]|uniref:Uncharacterized protein n=1 Tax=Dethiosulfatibacter aminovorans DSM 17477 TaxID=1121476 RepID=A0A1M6MXL9_9FIRM|nr:hypothetical protein [Dethiosulfatibacter aminovorans]SHJ88186.1 hypothetical protein SAMN02745751_03626 [Dethiosulfatibacter aminovorans DSM 17477]